MFGSGLRRRLARLVAAAGIALLSLGGLLGEISLRPAQAQEMLVEFRETLGAYGRWVEHPRWGAVWLPEGTPADWRPYRLGDWGYTGEWGGGWGSAGGRGWF